MEKITRESILEFLNVDTGKTMRDFCEHFSVSQPTITRALSKLSSELVRVGKGSRSRYFLLKEKAPIPIFQVGENAYPVELGQLFILRKGFYFSVQKDCKSLFGNEFPDGLFETLPWFLYEMRPQGYIGRAIARAIHRVENVSRSPQEWSDAQILNYLRTYGGDDPGALIIGANSRDKFLRDRTDEIYEESRETAYLELANAAISDGTAFSSAAGEQPKFSAFIKTASGEARHVIVKFSGDRNSPTESRRADLLISEFWAGEILREEGFPTPKTELIFAGERCFLESSRIDRIGKRGRRWTCSLASIEPALIGSGASSWSEMARAGEALGIFSKSTLEQVVLLENFGKAIGNDDMHWGNLSFIINLEEKFDLAPIYDMLPMAYRAREDSSFPTRALKFRAPDERSARMAQRFWQKIAADERISPCFKNIAQEILNSHAD